MTLCLRFTSLVRLSFLAAAAAGCAAPATEAPNQDDAITGIVSTNVGAQGANANCWAYTTNEWIQRLHTRVGGPDTDLSESYLSYWWWHRQILSARGPNWPGTPRTAR